MKRLKAILSKVLDVDEDRITDNMSPEDIEAWDSFNALMLVSELESTFKVKFTMEEVTAVRCVKDIKESLKKHGVKLKE